MAALDKLVLVEPDEKRRATMALRYAVENMGEGCIFKRRYGDAFASVAYSVG